MYVAALVAGVVDRMYITVVDQWLDDAGAVLFPAWCPDEWLLVSADRWHQWRGTRFVFKVYDRRG